MAANLDYDTILISDATFDRVGINDETYSAYTSLHWPTTKDKFAEILDTKALLAKLQKAIFYYISKIYLINRVD
ncbi:hypothetical protein E1176_05105 [Fulvivirga sp. RKSG066]|uniref:hypothetical protein n=1 Tax=Fulvivirga aurantia TaxID=2529383 RepID=UPI0012BD1C6E|nr:hypothetical protein [Fulvivirga aurantia]MTI20393.1 hypothetical protein [Fulvivirga aurantia]